MSRPFRFKQFQIVQEQTPMKVGTDGVMIAAWAGRENHERILDIGSGTAVTTLIAAQRFQTAKVVGIEANELAVKESRENAGNSPFSDRVEIIHCKLQSYRDLDKFDLILCNPPYFADSLKCPDKGRTDARHDDGLTLEQLIEAADKLLKQNGLFAMGYPAEREKQVLCQAEKTGFKLERIVRVRGTETGQVRRILVEFSKNGEGKVTEEEQFIEKERKVYSEWFAELTKELYLDK